VSTIAKRDNKVKINVIGGNAESVTGSCSVINYNGKIALFELGSIQEGHTVKENYNYNKNLISDIKDKDKISFVIAGHLHADHIANIPALYSNTNCQAKIIVPEGSKSILKDMWLDSAFINARVCDAIKYKTKKECYPIYTDMDVLKALEFVVEYPFGELVALDDSLSIRFTPAGHILFSAQTEMFFKLNNSVKKVTFTSDLGNVNLKYTKVFVDQFEPITKSNIVIGECTYSARSRITNKKDIQKDLQTLKDAVLKYCVKDGRILFIPCFALDRTPFILWLLYSMFSDDMTFVTRIIVDSPLAIKLLEDYSNELRGKQKELFDEMMNWHCIELSRTPYESAEAMQDGEPKLVISSSGMLDAGRGVRWAQKVLQNKQDCILFIGYATQNTNAYKIKNSKGQGTLIINGEIVNNKCNIIDLNNFSSHMQRPDLLNYYSNINCETIYLVHSNKSDKEEFAEDLRNEISKKNRSNKVICVDYKTNIIV
jgi:metallo-beta-lactamase family protein